MARWCIPRLLVCGLMLPPELAFLTMLDILKHYKVVRDNTLLTRWANHEIRSDNKKRKSMKAFWINQYNQEKDEFVTTLKSSLDKPSQHYTFQALARSFNGKRTFSVMFTFKPSILRALKAITILFPMTTSLAYTTFTLSYWYKWNPSFFLLN